MSTDHATSAKELAKESGLTMTTLPISHSSPLTSSEEVLWKERSKNNFMMEQLAYQSIDLLTQLADHSSQRDFLTLSRGFLPSELAHKDQKKERDYSKSERDVVIRSGAIIPPAVLLRRASADFSQMSDLQAVVEIQRRDEDLAWAGFTLTKDFAEAQKAVIAEDLEADYAVEDDIEDEAALEDELEKILLRTTTNERGGRKDDKRHDVIRKLQALQNDGHGLNNCIKRTFSTELGLPQLGETLSSVPISSPLILNTLFNSFARELCPTITPLLSEDENEENEDERQQKLKLQARTPVSSWASIRATFMKLREEYISQREKSATSEEDENIDVECERDDGSEKTPFVRGVGVGVGVGAEDESYCARTTLDCSALFDIESEDKSEEEVENSDDEHDDDTSSTSKKHDSTSEALLLEDFFYYQDRLHTMRFRRWKNARIAYKNELLSRRHAYQHQNTVSKTDLKTSLFESPPYSALLLDASAEDESILDAQEVIPIDPDAEESIAAVNEMEDVPKTKTNPPQDKVFNEDGRRLVATKSEHLETPYSGFLSLAQHSLLPPAFSFELDRRALRAARFPLLRVTDETVRKGALTRQGGSMESEENPKSLFRVMVPDYRTVETMVGYEDFLHTVSTFTGHELAVNLERFTKQRLVSVDNEITDDESTFIYQLEKMRKRSKKFALSHTPPATLMNLSTHDEAGGKCIADLDQYSTNFDETDKDGQDQMPQQTINIFKHIISISTVRTVAVPQEVTATLIEGEETTDFETLSRQYSIYDFASESERWDSSSDSENESASSKTTTTIPLPKTSLKEKLKKSDAKIKSNMRNFVSLAGLTQTNCKELQKRRALRRERRQLRRFRLAYNKLINKAFLLNNISERCEAEERKNTPFSSSPIFAMNDCLKSNLYSTQFEHISRSLTHEVSHVIDNSCTLEKEMGLHNDDSQVSTRIPLAMQSVLEPESLLNATSCLLSERLEDDDSASTNHNSTKLESFCADSVGDLSTNEFAFSRDMLDFIERAMFCELLARREENIRNSSSEKLQLMALRENYNAYYNKKITEAMKFYHERVCLTELANSSAEHWGDYRKQSSRDAMAQTSSASSIATSTSSRTFDASSFFDLGMDLFSQIIQPQKRSVQPDVITMNDDEGYICDTHFSHYDDTLDRDLDTVDEE